MSTRWLCSLLTNIAWITDPHLNHVPVGHWDKWIDQIRSMDADALVITGDLSEGDDVAFELKRLVGVHPAPIYFVLGNHDYYGRSIAQARREMVSLCRDVDSLHYLTDCGPIELGEGVFLVGDDGWGDATIGNASNSPVTLNDFQQIADFRGLSKNDLHAKLSDLGLDSAQRLGQKLEGLRNEASHLLVATHVPPFRESCLYDNQIADDDWAPFFVGGHVGSLLRAFADSNPQLAITVLCGHSHHASETRVSENLMVYSGKAEYGFPEVQGMVRRIGNQLQYTGNP